MTSNFNSHGGMRLQGSLLSAALWLTLLEEIMTDEDTTDRSRRTFMKGAAATGVAATGIMGFSGSAAAQQNIRELNVRDVNVQGGLVNLNISNVNILRDFDDLIVTIIGGDVLSDITIDIEEINILRFEDEVNVIRDVNVNVQDVLNDNVVQVAILALSDGDIVAAGSGASNDANFADFSE